MTPTDPPSPASLLRHEAFIGLGANLGEPAAALNKAFAALSELPASKLLARSDLYKTRPVDADGPDYLNAVARLQTNLGPLELLSALQQIETDAGRERLYRNAPRTLDLDLLLYDKLQMTSARLSLPHPRMHQRAFVLAPLAEIQPDLVLEPHGLVGELLKKLDNQPYQRLESFSREQ